MKNKKYSYTKSHKVTHCCLCSFMSLYVALKQVYCSVFQYAVTCVTYFSVLKVIEKI